jgi:hypothetical protein
MRISGIAACIFAVAAFSPCQAMSVASSGAAVAHSSGQAVTKVAKTQKAKKPEQPPQQAYVTFFWSKGADGPSMFSVFREKLLISMDGKQAGKITQGEFLSIPVDAGHHTMGYERVAISSEGETKREIDIAPGQTAYYEVIDKNESGFMHIVVPQEAAPDHAKAEIATLKAPLQTATKEAVMGLPAAPGAAATGGLPALAAPGVSAAAPQTGKPGKKGAAPQPVAQSFITFYWPKRTSGTVAFLETLGERIGLVIDGQAVGTFGEGEFVSIPVQPGSHNYSYAKSTQVSFNEKVHPVDVPAGQSIYFEIAEEQQGMVTVTFPQQVAPAQGQQALAGLHSTKSAD